MQDFQLKMYYKAFAVELRPNPPGAHGALRPLSWI